MGSEEKGDALFKKFWDWRLQTTPEFATFVGVHTYNDKLESYSPEFFEASKDSCEKFLNEAVEILAEPDIKSDVKRNLELFKTELTTYLKGMGAKGYLFPLCYLDGPHIELDRLVEAMPQETLEDYCKILSRYKALPDQISQIILLMRQGIMQKMTYYIDSVAGVIKEIDKFEQDPKKSNFYKPFLSVNDAIAGKEKDVLLEEAVKVVSNEVLPSFRKLRDFLEKEYSKHTRPDIGVSSLPNGMEYYQMCLDFHLGFHMTPKEVHEMGLKEVARISGEIEKVIESLELTMSVKDFSECMRKDDSFYFNNPEELLEAYNGLVSKEIEPKLHKVVKNIPKSKLIIKPYPPSMSGGPAAYYLAGTFDGKQPGAFYVNTADIKAAPKYEMMTLALHEAIPGHHLQQSYMMEQENMPDFRRFVEDRKYSISPSRFALHSAYVEGWGLYSEYLGNELGMYEDLYFRYGHLSHEMFRACRLVVDTGMHALGWSQEQAINYMLEYTGCHEKEIENEIRRYITWPGQACAYKVGQLKIKEIRKMAEKALGSRFNVQEFHEIVLQNAGPLNVLEQIVTEYVQQHGT